MSEDNKELDEFPILCETCLGENPMIRMTRQPHAKACKICDRPFTVYRWRPGGQDSRYKKTELCRTCAKLKNVCQTCVLDLQYGLPVQVRDTALEEHEKLKIPQSDVGREYMIEQLEREQESVGGLANHAIGYGATSQPPAILERLQRRAPYYKRNASHLCSFYARGACNRGALCPYRHEMPTSGPLAKQNIKDRYFGVNDPVANKMLSRMSQNAPALTPPSDPSITTLWVGGIQDSSITEGDIRNAFHAYGELVNVVHVPAKNCAFVTFQRRAGAEEAAKKLHNNLNIKGTFLKLAWGKRDGQAGKVNDQSQQETSTSTSSSSSSSMPAPPGIRSSASSSSSDSSSSSSSSSSAPSTFVAPNYLTGPLPPGMKSKPQYASQDPRQMASKLPV